MPRRKQHTLTPRTVALCYIRQSQTRDDDDANSPNRQRANIQAVCDRYGWTPEWYVDAKGHRSGRTEKNRPEWLALKDRLSDSDVAALVANDLSRLHRKSWHLGRTLDMLNDYGVRLVLAAPGRNLDTSTPVGQMMLTFIAMQDEAYANDMAQRARDEIAYRKRRNIGIGLPPFGTIRDTNGKLCPTPEGAWWLPDDRRFIAGSAGDEQPAPDAIWRGYDQAAQRVLQLYAQNQHGYNAIAYQIQAEGWAFRDRQGNPTPFEGDDVRRIVANWCEYGGLVLDERAKDRDPLDYPPGQVTLNAEFAVFPLELLYRVGGVLYSRSLRYRYVDKANRNTYPYPLAGLIECHHCKQMAQHHDNSKLRTRLGGKDGEHGRYRHRHGVQCGAARRSMMCDTIHQDFLVFLRSLRWAVHHKQQTQADSSPNDPQRESDRVRAKQIEQLERMITAARHLYLDGEITRDEYEFRTSEHGRTILRLRAQGYDRAKAQRNQQMFFDAIDRICDLWESSVDVYRQEMVRALFDAIEYDLDEQRIVGFQVKPWMECFVDGCVVLPDWD